MPMERMNDAMTVIPRYVRNLKIIDDLTSVASNDTSACCGLSPLLCPWLWCSVLMLCKRLRKIWVAQRQQWPLLQVPGKKSQPQSNQRDRHHDVQPRRHCP